MRTRASRARGVLAFGAALAILGFTVSGVLAGRSAIFTIAIDLDTGTETFTSDSPLLCPSGTATTSFEFGAGNFGAAGSFHLTKELVCADGSGSFVIRVDAATNFVVGDGTNGGWSVVPGSGTGDYAGLMGGGSIVGVNSDTPPIDLIDSYYGSLRL